MKIFSFYKKNITKADEDATVGNLHSQDDGGRMPRRHRDENRELGIITYAFIGIFVMLLVYLGYFTQFKSANVINNTYNKRQQLLESRMVRGSILGENGDVLACTVQNDKGDYVRYYPYGKVFSHIVGYSSNGVLGIESLENFKLLECNDSLINRVQNDLSNVRNTGNTVVTTLNVEMQKAAYDALGDRKGAVFAMNAKTGEILAVVSKPDFDPNYIVDTWDELNNDSQNSPLLNRAVLGQYPPGSTFKIVTALEYIKENRDSFREYDYDCNGSFIYNGSQINCYHGQKHGELDFNMSFAKSCNSSFANITSRLDKKKFEETCKTLLFNSDLPLPFQYASGITDISEESSLDSLLQTGIGQGKTVVSPAQITLITAAIANKGILMTPYIISDVEAVNGHIVERNEPKEFSRLMDEGDADILAELMLDVVNDGTGRNIKNTDKYTVGGKTGSAEYSPDKKLSHAWFTGYGFDEDDCIALTVIIEGGGSGGEVAVPVARSIFDAYYHL